MIIIGLYKAEAFRRFSFGNEIYESLINQCDDRTKQLIYLCQPNLKIQSIFHLFFSTLSIGPVKHRHVYLEAVIGANYGIVETLQ